MFEVLDIGCQVSGFIFEVLDFRFQVSGFVIEVNLIISARLARN